MTMTTPGTHNGSAGLERRPTGQLISDISSDVVTLVRQEAELARKEITEALASRMVGMAIGMVAGVLAILVLVFAGLAASQALSYEIPMWAARLTVAALFGLVVLGSLPLMITLMRRGEMKPAETLRTTKEDIEWAKTQLKR
jgi:lysylphosphatidylglycerol synthetase-like protein (DUF2156 family)